MFIFSFPDLHVFCGKDAFSSVSLHRAVLASCSPFMARVLMDRDETSLLLPDIDPDDFMALVHLVRKQDWSLGVYFKQLLGSAHTQNLVEIIFLALISIFC